MTFLNDGWVINLRKPRKWRTIMNLFKRKKKEPKIESIKRYKNYAWFGSNGGEITEQEYLDKELKNIKAYAERTAERVEVLEKLMPVDHIFILPGLGYIKKNGEDWTPPEEAREWARENGYLYNQTFKAAGELWIKREINA